MKIIKFIGIFIFIPNYMFASHDFLIGSGPTSQGYAGAGSADSNEPFLIFYNPSRITTTPKNRIGCGLSMGHKDFKINNNSYEKGNYFLLEGGLIIPFDGKLQGLYLGLALTFPQPSIMYMYSQDPNYPQFINYRNLLRYSIKPALAYKMSNRLSLGIALDIFGNSYGRSRVSIDLANQKTTQSDFIMDQKFTYTPIIGISYDFPYTLSTALSYRFKNSLNLKIDTNFDMQLLNMNVIQDGQSFFVPSEITLGVVSKPHENIKFLLDLGYIFFSEMPPQYVIIEIEPNVLFPSVKNTEQKKISAKDVIRIKLGWGFYLYEKRVELRIGYQYLPTPIPDQIYNTNLLDSDRHTFAIGSGLHLDDPTGLLPNGFDLNIYFQYHYLLKRSFNKVNPLDPYGDYSISGNFMEGGLGISFSL
ncbi:MAG: outer membrane protein transport protein [Deltaproteobacteria bacterium]|nr:outer membrane protein transport protein [Deltaproteobacteria bacterium]